MCKCTICVICATCVTCVICAIYVIYVTYAYMHIRYCALLCRLRLPQVFRAFRVLPAMLRLLLAAVPQRQCRDTDAFASATVPAASTWGADTLPAAGDRFSDIEGDDRTAK